MDNLEEMDKFLEMYNLPRLNQEEIENINKPIIRNEIETVIKNLPTERRGQLRGWWTHQPEGARCWPDLASLPEMGGIRGGTSWLEVLGPLEWRQRW